MNTILELPYGNDFCSCAVSEKRKVNILRASPPSNGENASEEELIKAALRAPIASPRLSELARDKKEVVVLTSDHTRPVPSHLTLPLLLEEIRSASPDARITILIATGCHRGSTHEEMVKKFGADFVARERIVNHDPHDSTGLVSLGRLPSGGELVINRLAAQAHLLVADGFIEPHQFAGFSGGRKSVLPGIASLSTVLASHNAEFTVHPEARPGALEGNPFHTDMLYAARQARLEFILNVALSPAKRVVAAFAGDMDKAHRAGCDFVMRHCGVDAIPAPLVITSNGGYPLDQNIYQATKSIMAADLVCSPGGVIIAVNECRDGHGSEAFYRTFKEAASLDALLEAIEKRGREETVPDQWVIQLIAGILRRRTVIFVTAAPASLVESFGMRYAPSLEAAVKMSEELIGIPDAAITVLPEAVSLILRQAQPVSAFRY
jgi:nickel-dependent lactate racemase